MILQEALHKVNQEYFSFEQLPYIKLSKGQDKEQRKTIIFGTYHIKKNEIKIHPVLLKSYIPSYVLEFVIYHELLHYEDRNILKQRNKGDKVHTVEFKKREKKFKFYKDSKIFLKQILYGKNMEDKIITDKDIDCIDNTTKISQNHKQEKIIKTNYKALKLSGEALEKALADSLKNLEHVLIKYNMIDTLPKGGKRGSKKKND